LSTARELLEQADALMRRNRLRGTDEADADADIPLLTEVVQPADPALADEPRSDAASERVGPADALANSTRVGDAAGGISADTPAAVVRTGRAAANAELDDVPLLTEAVADFDPISILGPPDDAEPVAPMPSRDDLAPGTVAASDVAVDTAPVAPPAPDGDAARWAAFAEEVRMQVLQRIDIFTDTGMREQLAARLQPIVDRASTDLVAAINQHVGQLLRAYVAEAIEREIDKWRRDRG
jgi:hypothetical protein